ncbi:TonB-dependent receptor [Candidatus Symbiothrix dinenymphae]|nr:TonB-dependent receptor [Candidatus Symbiothrix dinenymphae]
MRHRFFIFYFLVANCLLTMAQTMDSTQIKVLDEVEVRSNRPSTFQSTSSTQVLQAGDWTKLGAMQVSDAVKHFSGVQVKDYGGVGGLKTVSLRSLGANHTGVIYDGVPVSDMQTGQIDLGRFSLNFVDLLSLTIGESDFLLQTAQAQALAGALHITTSQGIAGQARNDKSEGIAGQARNDGSERGAGQARNDIRAVINVGSFGLLNPAFNYNQKLNSTFSASLSADYLTTDGDYPFAQTIGNYDSSEKQHKKRDNSDVETLKLEANLRGSFKNGGNLLFKNYFYTSERGLPGAALYHNYVPAQDRLNDRNFFSQIHYQQALREKIRFQTNAKFMLAHTKYDNAAMPVAQRTSVYKQREFYLNATFLYQLTEKISVSWANDGIYSDFESNQKNNVSPSRTEWLSALSGRYASQRFSVTAKLLNTSVRHYERDPQSPDIYDHLSPYLGFSLQPLPAFPLRMRGFYKGSFRLPTFGDIYYSTVTRTSLKPEKAQQYDLGLTFVNSAGHYIPYFSINSDIYWNKIEDKIVAFPTANMFLWSMQNYGEVAIQGIDLNIAAQIQYNSKFSWELNGTYTYQDALSQTPNEPATYNKRLPYTARHSASGVIGLLTPWVECSYNFIYCGKRYFQADNVPTSQMKPFIERGVSLKRTFVWQRITTTLTAECRNIGNVQYEVVRSYPMPARSFQFGIIVII